MSKGILVVDDSPAIRHVIRSYIDSEADLKVCGEAAGGVEAIEQASQLSPDLIVMDLSMPRMNGLAAARDQAEIVERTDHPVHFAQERHLCA